jgi:peptidoglycan/LPS O-acetylase OafA/YrhL
MTSKSQKIRLYFIDNLRILLIVLLVMHHLAITYGALGTWPYREGYPDDLTSIVFMVFTTVNQAFFLGLFFMISGYFTPGSYDRKGPWTFFKDRLIRLGIPLLFYILVIDPLIYYGISTRVHGSQMSFWQHYRALFQSYQGLGVGPLWFVEALLIFNLGYMLWRLLAKSAAKPAPAEGKTPGSIAIAVFAFLLGVVTFVVRIWLPTDWNFQLLGLPLPSFPQYIALFVIGIVASRQNWLQRLPDAMGKVWLWILLGLIFVLFPVVLVLGGALEGNVDAYEGGLHWQSFAYSFAEQFICMGMIITLLVWFRRRFNQQGALAKALAASSYAAYVIHAPVLVFLALALRGLDLYLLLKFALVAPVAIVLCFLLGYLLRQIPLVNRVL